MSVILIGCYNKINTNQGLNIPPGQYEFHYYNENKNFFILCSHISCNHFKEILHKHFGAVQFNLRFITNNENMNSYGMKMNIIAILLFN